MTPVAATPLATIIPIERVILMSVISCGLYLFYWFYVTWKHYRDHTKKEAYPVWHALTLFVPIYFLFRTHAHVRSFKELAASAGVPTSLLPGGVVVGVMLFLALNPVLFRANYSSSTDDFAVSILVLDILSIVISTFVLVHVQRNLNAYWRSIKEVTASSVKTGIGEIVFGILGVLSWVGTIVSLAGLS
ncbi:MAG: hypothetical protein V1724_02160 [Chloroflexota bacterium]